MGSRRTSTCGGCRQAITEGGDYRWRPDGELTGDFRCEAGRYVFTNQSPPHSPNNAKGVTLDILRSIEAGEPVDLYE